jgi:hypothetical protein
MNFVAIDFEIAERPRESACSVGLVKFRQPYCIKECKNIDKRACSKN